MGGLLELNDKYFRVVSKSRKNASNLVSRANLLVLFAVIPYVVSLSAGSGRLL